MATNIPDPKSFRLQVAPSRDPFSGGSGGTVTTSGVADLIDLMRDGVDLALNGQPDGGLTMEILPRKIDNPPLYLNAFGARYKRVDGS